MKCYFCKGLLEDGKTNFMTEMDNSFIIVKNVPARVCSQCGEAVFSMEVSLELEKLINSLSALFGTEVAIVTFRGNVA